MNVNRYYNSIIIVCFGQNNMYTNYLFVKSPTTVVGLGHNVLDVRRLWRSYLVVLPNVMSCVLKLDVLVGILFAVSTRLKWVVTEYLFPILAAAVAPAVRILICLPTCPTTIAAVIITATVVVAHVADAIPC